MSSRIFEDRCEAGRCLAAEIERCVLNNAIVLGLPRGGVPVAYEVALAIDAPLDVLVVRKLGAPFQPELALGAIASGGVRVLNEELLNELPDVDEATIEAIIERETEELKRREVLYRGDRPLPELQSKDVVLVDDGMATGATMWAAAKAVKQHHPAKTIIAVPTASSSAVRLVENSADEVICLDTPPSFSAVGYYYRDFGQTTDDDVRDMLQEAWNARSAA
jgi:putative phosphoribosyl transferase